MIRFLDVLPRAIRIKWKATVQTNLGRFRFTGDQKSGINGDSLHSPSNESQQNEAQNIDNRNGNSVLRLFNFTDKQRWNQDESFYRWPFSLSRTFGVIGWGTVVAFGLQFNKYHLNWRTDSNNLEISWLKYITYALPLSRTSILDFDKKPSHKSFNEFKQEESPQKKEEPDSLTDNLSNMVMNCVAIGENIKGIKAAEGGNFQTAVEHWKNSSNIGYSKSNFNLGLCYETGRGVNKDLRKAMEHYQKAADQGHCQAMYNLALLCFDSENKQEDSHLKKAINLLERAAKLGLPQAQTYIGVIYAEGETNNFSKAVEMFTAAAQQEDSEAFYYLGICFENGLGVEQSESKAAEYFLKAAESGHSEAQFSVARFYEKGLGGLQKDEKLAEEFYLKSANAGNENAQQKLQERLHESSGHVLEALNTSSMAVLNSKVKVLTNSFSSMLTNSVSTLQAYFNINNSVTYQESNVDIYLTENMKDNEEQLNTHLQYMPHCCPTKETPFISVSVPIEIFTPKQKT